MKSKMYFLLLMAIILSATGEAQSWSITGNSNATASSFLGTTNARDVVFRTNNTERGRILPNGRWRFGSTSNYVQIDNGGVLSFSGNAVYQVGGNKYVFQAASNPNYGLFFNQTQTQFEFRNGSAVPVFYINSNTGAGVFNNTLQVGAYTLPAIDGLNGQVLKTNGTGSLGWANDDNSIYLAGPGISIAGNTISNMAPDQTVTIAGTGNATVSGTYPDFTVNASSVPGPQGEPGPQGPQGVPGEKGDKGDIGDTGPQGIQGEKGDKGDKGDIGDTGLQGLQGEKGDKGDKGDVGETGPQGIQGIQGEKGYTGNTGPQGIQGIQGEKGDKGDIGETGPQGIQGEQGDVGDTGPQGIQGIQGEKGDKGDIGETGPQGPAGFLIPGAAAGNTPYWNGTNWVTSSSNIFNNGANVGIGTINPSARLEVAYGDAIINGLTIGMGGYDDPSNTALGKMALKSNMMGRNNTAVGYEALFSNTDGVGNTATGYHALYNNTAGGYNMAYGHEALYSNTTGSINIANGYRALYSNINGSSNIANGYSALNSNTTGNSNIAVGLGALASNTIGNENVATGESALNQSTTGNRNTAYGLHTLSNNTTGNNNTALGYNADVSAGDLTNATAIGARAFVGSSNSLILGGVPGFNGVDQFVNVGIGTVTPNARLEVAIGDALINGLTIGRGGNENSLNTAIGINALKSNMTSFNNTAVGYEALFSNTTGNINTAMGSQSLYSNSTGEWNNAFGYQALFSNTLGVGSTANGYRALYSNVNGALNVAVGIESLFSNTASENTAIGSRSLFSNTTGESNSALGFHALYSNTFGNSNTAIGHYSMNNNVTGSNNTALGSGSNVSSGDLINATAIGANTIVDASSKVRLGNADITSIEGQVNWSVPSDARIKDNMKENVPGLKFIRNLRPVTFHFNLQKQNSITGIKDTLQVEGKHGIEQIVFSGFIAQEVEAAAKKINYDFSGVDKSGEIMGLRYAEFVVPLVKSVQELCKMNDDKDAKIDSLQLQNKYQQQQITNLQTRLDKIEQLVKYIQQCNPCNETPGNPTVDAYITKLGDQVTLGQNIPNPFSNTTIINYTLPQKFTSAKMVVTDKNGKIIKEVTISGSGKGMLNVDASTLSNGAYQYSLWAEGKLVATKQMVLMK